MKTHLVTGENEVACGKHDDDLLETTEPEKVTCKTCRSTTWFQDLVEGEGSGAPLKGKSGFLPKELWKKYIKSIRGKNRLPSGLK
ncbi:hypothetical protein [Marinimicrobium sp. C2-29]|uniref:hypothetical protein n=1 Tax=Marinimicrobium sp. C2-29 TaxID=3139825 RepID=UPI0031394D92